MMKTHTKRYYTVKHQSHEFECHQCGWPVDVGDRALEVECNEREATFVVCSQACNLRDLEEYTADTGYSLDHCPPWGGA